MAQGDYITFNQAKLDILNGIFDLDTDDIRLGFTNSTTTPTATTAGPHWGGTGTTNLAANEVNGGNVPVGGFVLTGETLTPAGGTVTWDDTGNVSILQNVANPNNARWGILYDNTDVNKRAIGYLDLGGVTDMTAGDFTVTWNANGIFTLA